MVVIVFDDCALALVVQAHLFDNSIRSNHTCTLHFVIRYRGMRHFVSLIRANFVFNQIQLNYHLRTYVSTIVETPCAKRFKCTPNFTRGVT